MSFDGNAAFAHRFLPQMAAIFQSLAPLLVTVRPGTDWEDRHAVGDLWFDGGSGAVALRVRGPDRTGRVYRDLTLRIGLPGTDPANYEEAKIQRGLGRWYLYAWADDNVHLNAWTLIDLNQVRHYWTGLQRSPRTRRQVNAEDGMQFRCITLFPDLERFGCIRHYVDAPVGAGLPVGVR